MSKLFRPTGVVRTLRLLSQAGPRFKPCQTLRLASSQLTLRRSYSIQAKSTPLLRTTLRDEERYVEVTWGNGERSRYPYAWLRDCCRCDMCYLHTAKSRVLPMFDWKVTTKPTDILVRQFNKWPNNFKYYKLVFVKSKPITWGIFCIFDLINLFGVKYSRSWLW